MILDRIKKSYLGMQGPHSLLKSSQLFRVLGNRQHAQSNRDFAPAIQESSHQVSC